MKQLKEFLNTDVSSNVIETEIYDRLIAPVQESLVMTNLLALRIMPNSIPGSAILIDKADANDIGVHEIAEGAEFIDREQSTTQSTLTPKKYGMKLAITKEMQEDSKFAMMDYSIREAGFQMAKALDSLILASASSGAGQSEAFSSALTFANINAGIEDLEKNNYKANNFIMHPSFAHDIRALEIFTRADQSGTNNPSQNYVGKVPILGLDCWVSTQTGSDTGYIIDKQHALMLAEKRPITVEGYDDVTKDLSGAAVSARWASGVLQANAICKIS